MSFTQGAPTQPMSILASNVFLTGSSTAGNAFTVQQLGAGNVASFQTSTSSTSLIINPSGNVGIGKTNPGYALDVTGDINFTGTFRQNGTAFTTRETGAYLRPSSSNAATITQWLLGVANTSTTSGNPWNDPTITRVSVFDTSNVVGWSSTLFLHDGRVMFNAGMADTYGPAFFNPSTNQFSFLTGGQFSSVLSLQYGAMAQVPTGNVICLPTNNRVNGDYIGVYNPIDNSWSRLTVSIPGLGGFGPPFSAGVLGPDSNVYAVPSNTSNIGVYNPTTNSFSLVPITDRNSYSLYSGGVLLTDGRILFVPSYGTSNIGIFTPSTWSFSNVTVNTGGGWYNGLLLPNSNVLFVGDQKIGSYSPTLNTFTNILSVPGRAIFSAVLSIDGRVFTTTYNNPMGVYNWLTNVYADIPNSSGVNTSSFCGKLVPDGRIIYAPTGPGMAIIDTTFKVSEDFCKHPCINKS
jgi:hypothetical protein